MSSAKTPPRLRVMVADANEARGRLLAEALAESDYEVIGVVGAETFLPTQVRDLRPDIVLIDTDSPTRDTLEQLSRISKERPCPVVMFTNDDDQQTIRSAIEAGVSAYILDGISNARVRPIIDMAIAHFQRHHTVREELDRARQSLEERKMIDRAKGLLMERRRCTEPEAFAMLRKLAMDQKKRVGQVASEVLQVAGVLDSRTPRTRAQSGTPTAGQEVTP